MPPSVTSVMLESTVRVEKQHLEVTVHLASTVHLVPEWLNSFHAPMVLTTQNLES